MILDLFVSISLYHTFFCPSNLGRRHNDVIEACKMLKGMGIKVIFERDNLTLDDVLNLDIFTLARLTIETVKGDALVVIHSEKTYNEIMNG